MEQAVGSAFAKPDLMHDGTRALYLRGRSHMNDAVKEVLETYPLLKGLVTSAGGVCVCVTGDPAHAAMYIVEHLTPFSIGKRGGADALETTAAAALERDFTTEKLPEAHETFRRIRLAFYARNRTRLGTAPWTKPGLTCEGANTLWGDGSDRPYGPGSLHASVKEVLLGCPHTRSVEVRNDCVVVEVDGDVGVGEAALYVVNYLTPFRIVSTPPDVPIIHTIPD